MSGDTTEPSADIREMASAWWQLFVALQREGFTETQALKLVGDMVRGSMATGGGS